MDDERTSRARSDLVDHLRRTGRIHSSSVAAAVEAVPRHEFVPEPARDRAYEDRPLEIGRGQVVTAPHLVAQMTELLELDRGHRVLEVGTGSGYHAAVMAEIVGPERVFSLERFPDLATRARDDLERTGYGDVTVIVGDGSLGLPRAGPFDRISVAAVAPSVPDPLGEQLTDDGTMVIPLGPREGPHELHLVERVDGRLERTAHGRVRFVPLIGRYGFER